MEPLTDIFHQLFLQPYSTRVIGVEKEPIYLPARDAGEFHTIGYVKNSLPSFLHEVSHWFVAGSARRKLEDYGYWYAPDGRNQIQQQLFESVEQKPQAIEWVLSSAISRRFVLSCDNLTSAPFDIEAFQYGVLAQAEQYISKGLPKRAQAFVQTIMHGRDEHIKFSTYWKQVLLHRELPPVY